MPRTRLACGSPDRAEIDAALREIRECLETLGSLLSRADGAGLSGVPDDAILGEAERRGLKLRVNIRVVFDRVVALPQLIEKGRSKIDSACEVMMGPEFLMRRASGRDINV